jgi:hypothetical protein
MEDDAKHFTISPVNTYVCIFGGIFLLLAALLGALYMPYATAQISVSAMCGFMLIAVGINLYHKRNRPIVSIYPHHMVVKETRIDFSDILKIDERGKIELKGATHQLPLQMLSGSDKFTLIKLLDEVVPPATKAA